MSFFGSLIPSSQVNIAPVPQLPYEGQSARGAYQGIQSLGQYNLGAQYMPEYANLAQAGVADPYAAGAQQGAITASQMGMQAGQGAYGAGGQLIGQNLSLEPDVQSLIQMGFDPQQSLYAKLAQQTQDQQRAALAASGVAGTPYGAGVAGNTMSNFDINWANQQLQRALAGAGGASALQGAIGAGVQQGAGMQFGGAGEYSQFAGLPYSTSQNINAAQRAILEQAGQFGQQAAAIPQQQINDYLNYIAAAQRAQALQQGAQGQQLQQAQAEFNQAQQLGKDIGGIAAAPFTGGASLAMLGGGTGGGGGGGGGGGFSNPFAGFFSSPPSGALSGGLTGTMGT